MQYIMSLIKVVTKCLHLKDVTAEWSDCNTEVVLNPEYGPVYTEHQHLCCNTASDIPLIKLLILLNKLRKLLKKRVATLFDQI